MNRRPQAAPAARTAIEGAPDAVGEAQQGAD